MTSGELTATCAPCGRPTFPMFAEECLACADRRPSEPASEPAAEPSAPEGGSAS